MMMKEELKEANERLLDEIKIIKGENALCIRWIEIWKGIRGQCKMPETWVGHHDQKNPYFHPFFSESKP